MFEKREPKKEEKRESRMPPAMMKKMESKERVHTAKPAKKSGRKC